MIEPSFWFLERWKPSFCQPSTRWCAEEAARSADKKKAKECGCIKNLLFHEKRKAKRFGILLQDLFHARRKQGHCA